MLDVPECKIVLKQNNEKYELEESADEEEEMLTKMKESSKIVPKHTL
jgi:hypothetical protein